MARLCTNVTIHLICSLTFFPVIDIKQNTAADQSRHVPVLWAMVIKTILIIIYTCMKTWENKSA